MSCSSNCIAPVGGCYPSNDYENVTPSNSAYAVGDVIGTMQTLSGVAEPSGMVEIVAIELLENDSILAKKGISFQFFNLTFTSEADNAPFVFPPVGTSFVNEAGKFPIVTADYVTLDEATDNWAKANATIDRSTKGENIIIADGSGNLNYNLICDEIVTFQASAELYIRVTTRFHKK